MKEIPKVLALKNPFNDKINDIDILNEVDLKIFIAKKPENLFTLLKEKYIDLVILDLDTNNTLDSLKLGNEVIENYNKPFVYISSNNHKALLKKAIQAKPAGFLLKPFTGNELNNYIYEVLGVKKQVQKASKKEKKFVWAPRIIFFLKMDSFMKG